MTCLLAPCYAANGTISASTPATKKLPGKVKAHAAIARPAGVRGAALAKPTGNANSAAKRKAVANNRIRTEGEISGLSSETSDQLHGRLNLSQITPRKQWWIKTGGGLSVSRTIGKKKVSETDVSTFNLDTEYRLKGKNSYQFVSAVVNTKTRSPHASSYYDDAGYYMLSAGCGKTILPGIDLEAAMAYITQDRGDVNRRMTPVYSLRFKTPLNPSMTLDSDTLLVEPWADDNLVDSRVNLTYKFTPNLGMRFSYIANNILGGSLNRTEWDKTFRISLVFGP
jgi:hypothetical protein